MSLSSVKLDKDTLLTFFTAIPGVVMSVLIYTAVESQAVDELFFFSKFFKRQSRQLGLKVNAFKGRFFSWFYPHQTALYPAHELTFTPLL